MPESSPLRIALVDDHALVRDGIKAMLRPYDRYEIVGEAESGQAFLQQVEKWNPELVLLDIRMSGLSGLEVARTLAQEYPKIRVIMLTANTDEHHLREAIKAGAKGFLPKNTQQQELIHAIETVAKRESYFGEQIAATVFRTLTHHIQNPKEAEKNALSTREIEIIRLFADGLSYKEVAEALHISPNTVDSHRKNIQKKLGLKNIVELVRYAIREGIIEA